MVQEIDYQRKIVKDVRAQGGHGKKWATQLTVGVPDLVLSHHIWQEVALMEVKLFKDVKPRFRRKVGTTSKQQHELKSYWSAGGLSMVGVVVRYSPMSVYLCIVPWWHPHLDEEYLIKSPCCRPWDGKRQSFNVVDAVQSFRVIYAGERMVG